MLFYILLALLIGFTMEMSINSRNKVVKFFNYTLTIILPSFLFSVRYGIGTDYFNYINIFKSSAYGNSSRIEWAYYYINSITAKYFGNIEIAFFVLAVMRSLFRKDVFILAVIMMLFVYHSIKYYSEIISPGIAMFLFMIMFYQMSFNATRQVLAMTIILFSIRFIQEKKIFKFLIAIIIAAGFHNSAFVFLPMYFLNGILGSKKKNSVKLIIFVAILALTFSIDKFMSYFLINSKYFSYYLVYLNEVYAEADFGFVIRYLPFLIVIIYTFITAKESHIDKRFIFLNSLFFISIILKLSSFVGSQYLSRLSWNFEIVLILIIPYLIKLLSKKREVFISWALLSYSIINWWYVFVYNNSHETVPYRWIFDLTFFK